MRATENEKRDWTVIALILLLGLLGMLLAGGWALRFTPLWELDANVESLLDPNSDFLTHRPQGFIEPVDPAILTNVAWVEVYLTPGATFSNVTQLPPTTGAALTTPRAGTLVAAQTATLTGVASATNTAVPPSPANTLFYFPPPPSSTPRPAATPTDLPVSSPTSTPTSTAPSTPTQTFTETATPTATPTASSTPTSTPTATSDPSEPEFGAPDGNALVLGNGLWIEFNLSGFLLDGDPAWDLVYFEKEEASSAGKIHLGAVLIEVYDETTAAWYTVFYWGDGNADVNASYNNGNSEPDGFPVDTSLLYGVPPLNTGIAIDIDSAAIAQGGVIADSITIIRITSLSGGNCDIDALLMLR